MTSVVVPAYLFAPWVANMTERCLSLLREHSPDVEIVLVVRGEPTPPMRELADVILRPEIPGYAHACNVGVKAATGEVVVIGSTDAHVLPGWLPPLVVDVEERDGIATADHEDCNGGYRHAPFCGALFALRRSTWDRLGGMDETTYPMRKADQDFAIRAHLAGVVPRLVGSTAFDHVALNHTMAVIDPAEISREQALFAAQYGARDYPKWERAQR